MIFTKNTEEHNQNKQHKILTVFDDMIADMLSNKELFIRRRKLKNYLVFLTHCYFSVRKNIRLKLHTLFCYKNLEQTSASTNYP